MAEPTLSGYLPPEVEAATRTRDAINRIRRLPLSPTKKKKLLAVWFQGHPRAAPDPEVRHAAYLEAIGGVNIIG